MQVLNETETLVPAKTPVASVGGSTLTTDSWVADGSVHCPPAGARFEPHAASAPATRTVPARPRGPMFITFLRNRGSQRGYETRRVRCKGAGVGTAGRWCACGAAVLSGRGSSSPCAAGAEHSRALIYINGGAVTKKALSWTSNPQGWRALGSPVARR